PRTTTRFAYTTLFRSKQEWVGELNEGLLLLSAGAHGPIGQLLLEGKEAQADELAQWFAHHFPDRFYLEVQRAGRPGDETALHLTDRKSTRLNSSHVSI